MYIYIKLKPRYLVVVRYTCTKQVFTSDSLSTSLRIYVANFKIRGFRAFYMLLLHQRYMRKHY